jgi:hypothetical protein
VCKISLNKGPRALSAGKVTELDHDELALTAGDCLFLNNGHQPPCALIVWEGMILFSIQYAGNSLENFGKLDLLLFKHFKNPANCLIFKVARVAEW